MTRYVIGPDVAIRRGHDQVVTRGGHQILAPALLRSQVLSLLGERDAGHVLEQIEARGPRVVALSGHDSTPWTYDTFGRRFGDRYRTPAGQ